MAWSVLAVYIYWINVDLQWNLVTQPSNLADYLVYKTPTTRKDGTFSYLISKDQLFLTLKLDLVQSKVKLQIKICKMYYLPWESCSDQIIINYVNFIEKSVMTSMKEFYPLLLMRLWELLLLNTLLHNCWVTEIKFPVKSETFCNRELNNLELLLMTYLLLNLPLDRNILKLLKLNKSLNKKLKELNIMSNKPEILKKVLLLNPKPKLNLSNSSARLLLLIHPSWNSNKLNILNRSPLLFQTQRII